MILLLLDIERMWWVFYPDEQLSIQSCSGVNNKVCSNLGAGSLQATRNI